MNDEFSEDTLFEFDISQEVKNLINRYMNKITLQYSLIEIEHVTIS